MNKLDSAMWKKILSEKEINVIVDNNSLPFVLKDLGIVPNKEGHLIDTEKKEQLFNDDTETKMEEIGAILPGSRVFIKKNLAAYSQYLAEHD